MFLPEVRILQEYVERAFLEHVEKPSRYIGGEYNSVASDPNAAQLRVALAFPDVYEIGMSHTGLAILYEMLNAADGVCAQRVFCPWTDAQAVMKERGVELFTLESKAAVRDFDVLGFSVTNELCYTAVLTMLELAGVPLRTIERSERDPLVLVGGQGANCGEPLWAFADAFVLGQGEAAMPAICDVLLEMKEQGAARGQVLERLAREFDFVYVPGLYGAGYEDGVYGPLIPRAEGLRTEFADAVFEDFENAPVPQRPIVPFAKPVHERVSIEVMRGCPGRCRFCQASYCRRPIQFRSVGRIVEIAREQIAATGYDTVSLLSLSTADYPQLEELIEKLQAFLTPMKVGISVPSLKVSQQLAILPKLVSSVRKSGLTIAVEAASERLRTIIKKPITDADLFAAVTAAYEQGFEKLKLYFMVGLPGERQEDILQIVDLCDRLARLRKEVTGRGIANINAAVSFMVPKPHTPFERIGQAPLGYFNEARSLILDEKRNRRAKYLNFKFHDTRRSVLESAVARGGRELAPVIERAQAKGACFDLWDECFDFEIWVEAFAYHELDLFAYAARTFGPGDVLPWQHLGGPGRKYLDGEYKNALDDIAAHGDAPQ